MDASVALSAAGEEALEVLWADAERVFCRLSRQGRERHAFAPARANAERPELGSIQRLAHGRARALPRWGLGITAAGARARAWPDAAVRRLPRWRAARAPRPAAHGVRPVLARGGGPVCCARP